MELHIRDAGIQDIDEAAAFDNVRGERACAKQQVSGEVPERPESPVFAAERNRALPVALNADFKMDPTVRAGAGQIADGLESGRRQKRSLFRFRGSG